jgi:hypothetical protein
MSDANDSKLQYDPSESNSSDQRKLNTGYFLFALAALALACSSMSLVHSASLPDCAYTAMGDVTGNCH